MSAASKCPQRGYEPEGIALFDGRLFIANTGGYAPFCFNITPALKKSGKQTIRVCVWDASDEGFQPRGKQIEHTHGIWYTPVTGIWQTVWMEPVSPKAHISSYLPVWDAATSTLKVSVQAEGQYDEARVDLSYRGTPVGSGESIKIDSPRLWSPDSPNLYDLKITLLGGGKVLDTVDGYTCLRTVSVIADPKPDRNVNSYKRIGLNGERTFFFGPLDQGWWPDGLYTAPTDEALRYDIEQTKAFGYNMIRKHIKVEPDRWYYWCDKLGVLVWQDMPCPTDSRHGKWEMWKWALPEYDSKLTESAKANYYKEWAEIMDQVQVFPCIVVWVPFNEAWAQFDTYKVVEFTREKDPRRFGRVRRHWLARGGTPLAAGPQLGLCAVPLQ